MNKMKRLLGLLWMLLGPVAFFVLMYSAISNIDTTGAKDINNPLPWIIILVVLAPIAIGLTIFGWYAWKGEYEREGSGGSSQESGDMSRELGVGSQ